MLSVGPDGVLNSPLAGDDVHIPDSPFVWAGPDGLAQTAAVFDDVQVLPVGSSEDCDTDVAGFQTDGVPDRVDNCPAVCNANQLDTDNDGIGDACEGPNRRRP